MLTHDGIIRIVPDMTTLSDTLFQSTLGSIYSGELPPGAEVNEAVLAERFGVSRGPVREAVRRLQGIGLVTREPYMRAMVVSLSVAEVRELFEMREALEGMACRLAAQRMSNADLDAFAADLDSARRARQAAAPGAPALSDFDFHERIIVASGNGRISATLCGDLYHLLRVYRRRSGAVRERGDEAHAEHWQILRALRARDGELAESLMRAHVARASRQVTERLREMDSAGVTVAS